MTQCEIGKIGWLEPNILLVDIEERTEIGVEHMYEFNDIASKLSNNEQRFNIINYGAYSLPTKEAREPLSFTIWDHLYLQNIRLKDNN